LRRFLVRFRIRRVFDCFVRAGLVNVDIFWVPGGFSGCGVV
jgi:hypothetical protein